MPLIPCPDCGASISDRAAACPQCGCPGRSSSRPSAPARFSDGRRTQTVEATGKGWKALHAAGVALILAALSVAFTIFYPASEPLVPPKFFAKAAIFSASSFAFGMVAAIAGRVGAWWFHG